MSTVRNPSDLEASSLHTATPSTYDKARGDPQFTWRAVAVGLLVGTLVNFSNMYFGLQSESHIPISAAFEWC